MPKILVVEDDTFLANAYRVKLSKAGFEIRLVQDGEQVIQALTEFNPDIIILDLMIPKKDGFENLQEILQHPEWKHIPILVASNLGQAEDIDRAMKLGARGYVIKSDLSLNDLIVKIKSFLPPV